MTMKHDLARTLRRGQTDVERKLWYALRDRRFASLKFRRQHPIGPYVVDFICFARRLVIELDGSQHATEEARNYDAKRTAFLESRGFRALRFWNSDINENFDGVCEGIWHVLNTTPHLP